MNFLLMWFTVIFAIILVAVILLGFVAIFWMAVIFLLDYPLLLGAFIVFLIGTAIIAYKYKDTKIDSGYY